VVYKAVYDLKALETHVWHNTLNHLEKSKNWAIYNALADFKKNGDGLLMYLSDPNRDSSILEYKNQHDLLASFK